jgi:branched-chain amino acid transport system permease protein
MTTLLQQVANGIVLGAIIGLIALGYTMVYGIIQLINFAHGEVFMVGAYAGLATYTWVMPDAWRDDWYLTLPLTMLGGVVVATVIAVAMERFAYRPLRDAPRLAPLITALGVSVFLMEAVRLFYPQAKAALPFPSLFVQGEMHIPVPFGDGDVVLSWIKVAMVILAIALTVALNSYVNLTRLGRAMRATAQDRDIARLMGINPDRVIVLTFAIGGALAGVGGVLFGAYQNNINVDMGFQNGIFAFTAAVLGGIGSIRGAVIGAFMIGLVKTLGGQYLPGGSQYDYVWIFIVLILVLVFRPEGLFGEAEKVRA